MTVTIESKVQRGKHVGDTQIPHQHEDDLYVVSPTKFEGDYIRVGDLRSVANAVAAGLHARMKAETQDAAGLVQPESILIDGLSPDVWHQNIAKAEGRT
jgi:hypothetical protein